MSFPNKKNLHTPRFCKTHHVRSLDECNWNLAHVMGARETPGVWKPSNSSFTHLRRSCMYWEIELKLVRPQREKLTWNRLRVPITYINKTNCQTETLTQKWRHQLIYPIVDEATHAKVQITYRSRLTHTILYPTKYAEASYSSNIWTKALIYEQERVRFAFRDIAK